MELQKKFFVLNMKFLYEKRKFAIILYNFDEKHYADTYSSFCFLIFQYAVYYFDV